MCGQPPSAVLRAEGTTPSPPKLAADIKSSRALLDRTAEGGCPHTSPRPQEISMRVSYALC